jgi:hypothetical protein
LFSFCFSTAVDYCSDGGRVLGWEALRFIIRATGTQATATSCYTVTSSGRRFGRPRAVCMNYKLYLNSWSIPHGC